MTELITSTLIGDKDSYFIWDTIIIERSRVLVMIYSRYKTLPSPSKVNPLIDHIFKTEWSLLWYMTAKVHPSHSSLPPPLSPSLSHLPWMLQVQLCGPWGKPALLNLLWVIEWVNHLPIQSSVREFEFFESVPWVIVIKSLIFSFTINPLLPYKAKSLS